MLKGNAIVGQSGGPTAAINATLAGVIEGAFGSEAIGTIYGAFNGIDGILEERICDLGERIRGEDDLKALANTPAAALGSCMAVLGVFVARSVVYREKEFNAVFFSLFHKILCKLDLVRLAEGFAYVISESDEEGVCHAAADDESIDL